MKDPDDDTEVASEREWLELGRRLRARSERVYENAFALIVAFAFTPTPEEIQSPDEGAVH